MSGLILSKKNQKNLALTVENRHFCFYNAFCLTKRWRNAFITNQISFKENGMFSKKTFSVLALSVLLASGSVWAASQKDSGRAGIPSLGKNAAGKQIVPKTLKDIPGAWCPARNPAGWDHVAKIETGTNGWACSQLHLSGESATSLFDKAYVNAAAPGAKNLAYDYLLARVNKSIADGVPNAKAWGDMNKLSQNLHQNNVVGNYQNSFSSGGYNNYDDPASALMFDVINRCGCVVQFDLSNNTSLDPDNPVTTELPDRNNLQDGCPGAAQLACAQTSRNISNNSSYWGPNHQYNKTFQDLANSCINWWNTIVNNTFNEETYGITDPDAEGYTQICNVNAGGGSANNNVCVPLCPQLKDQCGETSFIGPGLIVDKTGQRWTLNKDGSCTQNGDARVDIVAQ